MRLRSSPSRRSLARTLAVAAGATIALVGAARAEPIAGLVSGNRLVVFDSATPGTVTSSVAVSGLGAGQTLVGIDLRPTTGLVYGLSSSGQLYTLNPTTGVATSVGTVSVPLSGTTFGIDFNPVPDLAGLASLRITSDTGQNLRVNVNPGLIGTATVDGALNGATTSLSGSAYTNNDLDPATATALYGISGSSLYQQTNPNGGTLALIGPLGTTTNAFTGFDVSALSGTSFASLTGAASTQSGFYTINLATGAATLVGLLNGTASYVDVTALTAPIPEPETYALMLAGLGALGVVARRRRGLKA